ncbi:unnamed protein product, partial [Amoebophrya sp. A25]
HQHHTIEEDTTSGGRSRKQEKASGQQHPPSANGPSCYQDGPPDSCYHGGANSSQVPYYPSLETSTIVGGPTTVVPCRRTIDLEASVEPFNVS